MQRLLWLRLLAPLAGRLPGLFYRIAWAVGWAAWKTQAVRRRNLINNLLPLCDGNRARAESEGLQAYRNVAQYWVDLATVPRRRMADFEHDHLRFVGGQCLAILNEPGPIVAVSAHTGNPDLAIQALTYRGRPFVALVEPLDPPAVRDYMLKLRSAAGGRFYEANFRGIRGCVEALKQGQIVGVAGDRDIQGTGICVDLAGRCVRLPRGPWELARRTGATVLPVFSARDRHDHFTVYVDEPFRIPCTEDEEADVRLAVARFATILEAHLRRDPGQWAVLEDFWGIHGCE